MSKNRIIKFDKVVGITEDDEIYICNDIFDHGDGFQGATGSVVVPITQAYIDERNDLENVKDFYGDLYEEADIDHENVSLDEYVQSLIDQAQGYGQEFLGHDDSDCHLVTEEVAEYVNENIMGDFEAVAYECIAGGRCFHKKIKWKKVFDQKLLDLINKTELSDDA